MKPMTAKDSLSWLHFRLGAITGVLGVVGKNLARSIKSASDIFREFNEAIEKIKKEKEHGV